MRKQRRQRRALLPRPWIRDDFGWYRITPMLPDAIGWGKSEGFFARNGSAVFVWHHMLTIRPVLQQLWTTTTSINISQGGRRDTHACGDKFGGRGSRFAANQ
eukprot:symbB.v1.2.036369.t1/scaffold5055.1/size50094/4